MQDSEEIDQAKEKYALCQAERVPSLGKPTKIMRSRPGLRIEAYIVGIIQHTIFIGEFAIESACLEGDRM